MATGDATAGLEAAMRSARRNGWELRHVSTTGSTNHDLAQEALTGEVGEVVLVADHQTAGRGRRDRTWDDSGLGDLLVSVRLPVEPAEAHGLVSALAAAARAAAEAECGVAVSSKWPNDLVVESGPAPGKLAGVLAELITGDRISLVIGIGINLEPVPGQPGATSVRECGGSPDRDRILTRIIDGFAERREDPARAAEELMAHSATLGRRVQVDIGSRRLLGTATRIAPDGRLEVVTDSGPELVAAGDVVHLREAAGSSTD